METGYEPLNVLKPIGPDIWIVDGPTIKFYGMPFPTRMTVIRLQNGDLFIHSPIAPDDGLFAALDDLGVVRHLVSPNWIHYASIGLWGERFPGALAWASPGVRERARKYLVAVSFDRDLGEDAPYEWAGQIAQIIVHGSSFHEEVVFFHEASNVLILTDLIENFEAQKMPFWFRPLIWLAGINGGMPRDMRLTFRKGHKELALAIQTMLDWKPEKIVIAHGRWFGKDGSEVLRRIFSWVLPD